VRLLKLIAAAMALLTCLLSGSGFAAVTRSKPQHRHRTKEATPATIGADIIFVTNVALSTVGVYPGSAFGDVPPLATEGLAGPSGIARDAAGNIYTANSVGDEITIYADGSNGSPSPIAQIFGSNTGLSYPVAVALDSIGNIYVANAGSSVGGTDSIAVYPPGSNGNIAPTAVITGTATELDQPGGDSVGFHRQYLRYQPTRRRCWKCHGL